MTNHKVPLPLIYFNWCVIYAAARLGFALLSINKPHSKSQQALKRNTNKQRSAAWRGTLRAAPLWLTRSMCLLLKGNMHDTFAGTNSFV